MPRRIKLSSRYKKSYRRLEKRGNDMEKLHCVIEMLCRGEVLPVKYRNHPLKGNWNGHMECHLGPDWLLIYQLSDEHVFLVESGTHSDLFDK